MSKKLYDACRRYKYFYKKHEDVKSWNSKYHDIDLTQTVAKTNTQLNDVSDELLMRLFDEYEVFCTSLESSHDVSRNPIGAFERRVPYLCHPYDSIHTNVEFQDSGRFLNVLTEHIMKNRY